MSAASAGLLKEFQQIGTSTWSDILDEIGVQGVIGGGLPVEVEKVDLLRLR